MKILIVCYPRVGSRYLANKLRLCVSPYRSAMSTYRSTEVSVTSTHDRNIDYLYKNLNLKKTDVVIHLIANPYNSIVSFFNAWPQNKNLPSSRFVVPDSFITPMLIENIEKYDNSFAIQSNLAKEHAIGGFKLSLEMPSGFKAHNDHYYVPDQSDIRRKECGVPTPLNIYQTENYQEIMLRCDFLQHEHHFDRIINNNLDFRMVTLKYEGLAKEENINKLKDFLGNGFEGINSSDFSPRKSDWRNSIFKNEIENVYGSLHKKYSELPDIKIWR